MVQPQQITRVAQTTGIGDISTMITAIMPLIMIVMLMKMITPMLEGMGGS